MSLFKKSQEKIEAEKLYSLLSDKTGNYTIDEIKHTIKEQGYSEKVSNLVIKIIIDNKLPLKKENKKEQSKDDVLKELSLVVNNASQEKINANDLKEDEKKSSPKQQFIKKDSSSLKDVSKVSFFKKVGNFFKMIYFFFENIYYSIIDGINKVIPINKLTDAIDKVFPSFILAILILALFIYLFVSGTISFSKSWTIAVEVYDPSNTPLSDVLVTFQIKDDNISFAKTNVFGEAMFTDIKTFKRNVTLIASKENYNTTEHVFKLNKKNLRQKISLSIDTENPLIPQNPEEEREIMFVENENTLITNATLNVSFSCSNTEKIPEPKLTLVSNGKILVKTPAACGSLRVSVTSTQFSSITNKVIDSTNKVLLTRLNTERGKLAFSVKDISGNAISGAEGVVYNNSTSSTLLPFNTTITDFYGLGQFTLEPKQYLLSVSKAGYLTQPYKGPLTVTKDSTTNTEIRLFTIDDLLNFNCNNSKYKDYCVNDKIDCSNPHLKPFLKINTDGTCSIGKPGYISVTLKDVNTGKPVFADITLESKLKNSDANYSYKGDIARDTNFYKFNVIDFYDYRVKVLNTENNGYIQPDPYVVSGIDVNVVISLEYSSVLNSGTIRVNVKNEGENISYAKVYLYRESKEGFDLTNIEPMFTNKYGDVNFTMQRANRNYYAYAIHPGIDKEGVSSIKKLDANSFLNLNVNLKNVSKILNLKVSPDVSYDINFYDSLNDPVTEYVAVDNDSNKQFYFTGTTKKVYAIISSEGYTSYQTELITLVPDQEIFKTVTLSSLSSCADTKLEIVGLYDKSGVTDINKISYFDNGLSKEYKIKFKYTSCLLDADEKHAFIRAGDQTFINDDYIFLVSEDITSEDVEVLRGYKFSGEHIPDFNIVSFNKNYKSDTQYGYSGNGYKWIMIDLIDLKPNILEFSLNFKLRETPIAPTEYYTLNYRSLAIADKDTFAFDPVLPDSWNQIPIYPKGYFYAKTNKYQLPFENTDYSYQIKLKDFNGFILSSVNDGYQVSINDYYKYDVEYLYLKNTSRNGKVVQSSANTNNNLEFSSYGYTSSLGNSSSSQGDSNNSNTTLPATGFAFINDSTPVNDQNTSSQEIYYHIPVNDLNFSRPAIDINRGYSLNLFTLFKPTGFFDNSSSQNPKLVTDLFTEFPKINTNVYSYYSDVNYVFEITTKAHNNQIVVGDNIISFKVKDNFAKPVQGVSIIALMGYGSPISLGFTNEQGILSDQNIFVNLEDIDRTAYFFFRFSPEYGFIDNTVVRSTKIFSGLDVLPSTINLSVDYYTINNNLYLNNLTTKNYSIIKSTNLPTTLNDISFVAPSNVFNLNKIKENMHTTNNIPLTLIEGEKELITSLELKNNTNQSGIFNTSYRNIIEIDYSLDYLLDANAVVTLNNLGDLNYSIWNESAIQGMSVNDENINIEFIMPQNPFFYVNYMFYSSSGAVLKNITSSNIPDFINSDSFNQSLSTAQNNVITSNGNMIPIAFFLNVYGNYESLPIEDNLTLTFNFDISGKEISFTKKVFLKVFDANSLIDIFSNNNSVSILCTEDNCSQNKTYTFRNNSKNYEINVLPSIVITPENEIINANPFNTPFSLLNESVNKNIVFSSNYSTLTEENTVGNANILFNSEVLNVLSPDIPLNKEVSFNYTITKISLDQTTSEIDFDYCLGVGGQESAGELFILGYCQDQQESCFSGEEYLPKVFFNWGESALDGSWKTKCIGVDAEGMNNKYACDSLQMLLSIFNKIGEGVEEKAFYIKLLNDGISNDLLKDFTNYPTTPFNSFDRPRIEIFSPEAVDQGKFKIVIDGNEYLKTYTPGIYKVMVYGNTNNTPYSGTSSDQFIDIRLNKVASLPLSELSVFHYMPFNGNLNKNGTRNGYGVKVLGSNDVVLNKDVNLDYTQVSSPIKQLMIINNNSLNGLYNTINSNGKLLLLESSPNDYLKMTYTPSYPVPLYSHLACLEDNNFSYSLLEGSSTLNGVIGSRFLTWYDTDKIYKDKSYTVLSEPRYILEVPNLSDNNLNINTVLYVPTARDISSIYFKISELNNNSHTLLFTKGNLSGVETSTNILFSNSDHEVGNNLERLRTVQGLFNYIKDGKACIYKSPSKTYIKWVDEKVNFTENELEEIQNKISSLTYTCNNSSQN